MKDTRKKLEIQISSQNQQLQKLISENDQNPSEHLDNCIAAIRNDIQELTAQLRTLPVSRTLAQDDGDFEFSISRNDGGTGHGDISYSDADSGL